MGNILVKIKRFLSNKNTVTILCVLAGILVIYIGYNWRVSEATNPTSVPYANKTLTSGTVITKDDISYMEVSSSVLSKAKNMITSSSLIIGKAVAYGDTIQANSFFFSGDLKDAGTTDYYPLASMEEDEEVETLPVNLHTTFGNAIYPGNYIDLWFKGYDSNGKLIYGKFIQSIRVLDVTDSDGRSVFETGAESRTPASITFALKTESNLGLTAAELKQMIKTSQDIGDLIPVPRNRSYTENPGETAISSSYLYYYILSQVSVVPLDDDVNAEGEE